MRDIARSVSLNPGSLYNHFSSKQVLYEAVLERGLRPMFDLLDDLARSDSIALFNSVRGWIPARLKPPRAPRSDR